ncbi:YihY/virulence factor BrkB family protein [Agromyces intestinalis]|uniref:YihY/virulence factor BrkB family protein n=1 Tax=Agromyces intestinalis TaxID=2592652 RepID=A0A5C1YH23_9MICO|nr:YihY/virulence factor BrkB family protein [Agromyces intestinalis]QEO14845.1 YihY/virulence factor BrkB family protein [Agromyces intestinalis]
MPDSARPRPDGHDSPARFSRDDWRLILRRTWHEARINQWADIAAALTYYVVLATFPALLAALALIGGFGSAERFGETALDIVGDLWGNDAASALDEPLAQLLDASHQWSALIVGMAGALWAISGYLGVFGRGMNRILDVEEGRPFWRSRPAMLLVAAGLLVLAAAVAVLLIVSGPVAGAVAEAFGLDEGVAFWWDLAKLPVAAALVALAIALLYWATPNVKRRHVRWMSVGAASAVLAWIITTGLFGVYVLGFRTYERNYGVLGGAVAFLLWVWLSNLAVVLGAVLDTEVERLRQLRAGIAAEVDLKLPLRDERMVRKNHQQRADDIRLAAEVRREASVIGS